MPSIDIIVPVFNEQEVLPLFQERIHEVMDSCAVEWRVIFVDDGSSDDSLAIMKSIHTEDPNFGYLSLSRNFGKEYALTAGLDQASADDDIGKESILEALTDVVRDAKGTDMNFTFDGEDDFGSYEDVDFSSLADLEN